MSVAGGERFDGKRLAFAHTQPKKEQKRINNIDENICSKHEASSKIFRL